MIRPDPVLTASVFCDGLLDEVIHGAVEPFRQALRREAPGWKGGIWMVRYARGGMHLKLRLHGPGAGGTRARELLKESVDAFFATLPPRDSEAPRVARAELPAIDDEDRAEGHPDRSLLWTTYNRSHVNLGPDVFLDDDAYVARMCTALAAAGGIVLDTVEPGLAAGRRLTVLRR
ncbi:MAG TPA: lantibiotic dehydratase C-terminal domain-containing protein, partial [Longimicrobium sp.]|nr:lantibiotic dehydratase C-terminal domain-containing protein [Longimicrobium sp.]